MMGQTRKVVVIIPGALGYANGVALGVCSVFSGQPGWSIHVSQPLTRQSLRQYKPDGVIINLSTRRAVRGVAGLKAAVVNYSGVLDGCGYPTVRMDDLAIGRMAADYFFSLGLRYFAFWSSGDQAFSKRRWEGFRQGLVERLIPPERIFFMQAAADAKWEGREREIGRWLRKLPRPAGLMAVQDCEGCRLGRLAAAEGIDVPNELALLGVDNDRLFCEQSCPPLSSIATPAFQVGRRAALMMRELLTGGVVPAEPVELPPLGVVQRGSTRMLAIADADLAAAVRLIHEHAAAGLSVPDVLRAVPLSRRALESRFRRLFRRSPGEEIRRVRVEVVRRLLLTTTLPITEIARRCGYCDAKYLATAFRRETGQSPSACRRAFHGDVLAGSR